MRSDLNWRRNGWISQELEGIDQRTTQTLAYRVRPRGWKWRFVALSWLLRVAPCFNHQGREGFELRSQQWWKEREGRGDSAIKGGGPKFKGREREWRRREKEWGGLGFSTLL